MKRRQRVNWQVSDSELQIESNCRVAFFCILQIYVLVWFVHGMSGRDRKHLHKCIATHPTFTLDINKFCAQNILTLSQIFWTNHFKNWDKKKTINKTDMNCRSRSRRKSKMKNLPCKHAGFGTKPGLMMMSKTKMKMVSKMKRLPCQHAEQPWCEVPSRI